MVVRKGRTIYKFYIMNGSLIQQISFKWGKYYITSKKKLDVYDKIKLLDTIIYTLLLDLFGKWK